MTKLCSKTNCRKPRIATTNSSFCRPHYNAYMREWNKRNPERVRNSVLKKLYGISLEQYDEMLARQNGVCAICQQPEWAKFRDGRIKALSVDHCHESGNVRGLLCVECNTLLAKAEDNIELLKSAIKYLRVT